MAGAILFFYHWVVAVNATTVALSLLLAILAIATGWGLLEAIVASLVAVLGFNYFFLPPVETFTIADPQNWVALVAFLVTAMTASQLSARARRRAAEAEERRQEVEKLYALGQALLLSGGVRTTARETVNQILHTFGIAAAVFFSKAENEFFRSGPEPFPISDERLRAAVDQSEAIVDAEKGTAVAPVRLGGQAMGSLGFSGCTLSKAALQAVAYLVAIGIERARSVEEASRLEAARQSEALKSALLDALAHDLKTPLTSIKGAVTHLMAKKRDAEEEELLALANEEADRLNSLVAEVVAMARIEAGKLHPERRPHAVADIVAASLKELEGPLADRPVQVDLPAALPPADVNFEFIQQAVKQLLDNAVKYSPPGSPVSISAQLKNDRIVVSVADRGRGIDEQEQSGIFDKFYRGRESRYEVEGMGLGLSIAKGIVEAHGGKIWVASQPGSGSVFSFSLPVYKGEPAR
jgi:two-component system sensor histidine kinase KdpD